MEVLERLDGRLSVRHEGRIIASQKAPPSPVFLRNGHGASASVPVPTSGAHGLGERWTAALEPLDSRADGADGRGMSTDGVTTAGNPAATATRKPTFLQKERWKAIQKARRKGMSLRAIERELGIHRATIKNTWMPKALQRDNPGRLLLPRHHLIPSRPDRVTFPLNT